MKEFKFESIASDRNPEITVVFLDKVEEKKTLLTKIKEGTKKIFGMKN